jgi:predicted O-linked N-acetylglucosamine transferase (SPINDLY family)
MNAQSTTKAYQCLLQGNNNQAVMLYEQAISAEPEVKAPYWYLGLVLLLQGQVAEAQTTWLMGMVEGEPDQIEQWTEELRDVLLQEAARQEALEEDAVALTIRQQLVEICPTDINNGLRLIELAIKQQTYSGDELTELGIIEKVSEQPGEIDSQLLMSVLQSVLDYAPLHPSSLELAEACITHARDNTQVVALLNLLQRSAIETAYVKKFPETAASIAELALRLDPKNRELLYHAAGIYILASQYPQGIETAKLAYSLSQDLPDVIFANYLVIKGLLSAGGTYWQETYPVHEQQQSLLRLLVEEQSVQLTPLHISRLFNANGFAPYLEDRPKAYCEIRNQVAQLCQANHQLHNREIVEQYKERHGNRRKLSDTTKRLKIGYLSHCFRSHSVGWLARWVFQHHDRERFDLNGYFAICDLPHDRLHQWYVGQFSNAFKSNSRQEIAEKIYQDEIDILIDLDSLTLDISCLIMAQKPAPIQVTWLGWDASGIPAIDYVIADPYVLPESAQEYYTEKIWRLPQTYVAVDGFEVNVPTLRREDLDIPSDAVVYFSSQRGFKRHPDTARLQMQILKAVPNSYFLIKGSADEESIKTFFTELAEAEGVECDRLRFLPGAPTEAIHRANLGIADVVLDTYPYNGATTTLETLWMCVPLVTRVGEQFAARNSYTMMMNVGITEGIAWTDEEYVEWGIRLGKDEALRQQVSWKLRQSRRSAPLWNANQFTRELENAYEQMWQRYVQGG